MAKLPIPKVIITSEMKEHQLKIKAFLRGVAEIQWKELRPIGFQIDISTIPFNKVDIFLEITNKD